MDKGQGPKVVEGTLVVPPGTRFALVASRFNHFIVDRLVEGALDAIARHDGKLEDASNPGAGFAWTGREAGTTIPGPMKKRPLLPLVAAFATMALTASCQCSGGKEQSGKTGESGTQTTGPAALAERSFRLPNGLQADLVDGACGESAALVVLLGVGIDHDPPGRSGMAHLAERVLATSVGAKKAARTVEKMCIRDSPSTGPSPCKTSPSPGRAGSSRTGWAPSRT